MAASSPPDGLTCCRRRRPIRQPVGGYVYLNSMRSGWWCCIPFWGFVSSALVDFGLKTAELFFFFTGVDVADGLSSSSGASIRASAHCLLRHFHGLGPPHRLGRSLLSLSSALSASGLQGGGGRSELRETRRRRRTGPLVDKVVISYICGVFL